MYLQNLQIELTETILTNETTANGIFPTQHLLIYQNNHISHLVNTLERTYPLLVKLVGEDFFRATAKEYIKFYPARSGNLHEYGEYFGYFLAHFSSTQPLYYLPEVALFEWACHTLSFAADHPPFNSALLTSFSIEQYPQLHFVLHPACRVMKFNYPILRIIDLCKGETEEEVNITQGEINLLILRRHQEIMLSSLTTAEYLFLEALSEEKILSAALNAAVNVDAHFDLEEKLKTWTMNQTIVDCYLENTTITQCPEPLRLF